MDQEPVRLMVCFAVLPERLAYAFALFSRVGEDQALFASGVFEYISRPRICSPRRCVRRCFDLVRHLVLLFGRFPVVGVLRFLRRLVREERDYVVFYLFLILACLRERVVEVFHGEPPDFFSGVELRDQSLPGASCGKELPGLFGFSYRCGEADPPWVASGRPAETFDQAE